MVKIVPFALYDRQQVVGGLPLGDAVTCIAAQGANSFLCVTASGVVRSLQYAGESSGAAAPSDDAAAATTSDEQRAWSDFDVVAEFRSATPAVEQILYCRPN